jgi:voltage-gated potassium channel Kch
MDTVIGTGDAVIAVSEDDDTVILSGITTVPIDEEAIRVRQSTEQIAERTLILGWNRGGQTIVRELDNYVSPASQVTVVANLDPSDQSIALVGAEVAHQRVTFLEGDITDRRVLDELDVTSYDHIITLSYTDSLDVQAADARTLITLLHLRDIVEKTGKSISIVSEMLDIRNRELAQVTRADDFIVSNQLVSLLLTQIAENRELLPVFLDLFDADGSELYLKPASEYVGLNTAVSFYTVVESARRRGEAAIGYRIAAQALDTAAQFGVHVNPRKSEQQTFRAEDRIIVVAEE